MPNYTLQLLNYHPENGGQLGAQTAPIMGALIDKFNTQYINTLVLAAGDSYIPGPWLVGGSDPSLNSVPGIGSTALGRPNIAIMNAFGTNVSALGNHEFDLGSPVLRNAITPSGTWVGAKFPLITANLDFSADSSLSSLADATLGGTATNNFAGQEAAAISGKIAPYTVVTKGGEKIGIIGATTYDLSKISSPNGTVAKDDNNPSTSDLQEVAAYVQSAVNALKAQGINKIVMVDALDTIELNKSLAPLVSGIDVIITGGNDQRLGDATDKAVSFNGHSANFVGTYPIVTAGADGKTTLIVATDSEYTYLGRLVVDFDANGEVVLPSLNPVINGAYASTEANLQAAYSTTQTENQIVASSTIGTNVKAITTAVDNVIVSKDSNIFGYTNVYLEGDSAFGRAQEVNLGDISADANLFVARKAIGNGAILASLKNGGGIRGSIGAIDGNGQKIPPSASSVKPAGGISQLDIENALRFDNKLMVFDTTPQGLLNILNYAAGLAPGNGGFPQIGGIRFSYDPNKAVGQRVQDVAIYDLDNNFVAKVADNGVVLSSAPAKISVSILNFTANGGDGYPIRANADNFRYLLNDGTLSAPIDKTLDFTAAANVPVNGLGEQKAFQDLLKAKYGTPATAYGMADTPASQDQRIQNLTQKEDTVFPATLSIAASTPTATETNTIPGVFTVNSDIKAYVPLTFNYTVGGTATNGVDYNNFTGTATIAAGQSSVDIKVTPVDDTLAEENETVTLTLASGTGYTTDTTKSAATITIIDNEPTVSVSAEPGNVNEGQPLKWNFALTNPAPVGGLVVKLDLVVDSDPLPGDISYFVNSSQNITNFELVRNADGTINHSLVTIAAGATTATLVNNVIADGLTEGAETIVYTLAARDNYKINPTAKNASFTIVDTSLSTLSIAASTPTATEFSSNPGVFTVTSDTKPNVPITFNYTIAGTATNGGDYNNLTGTATIAVGQSSVDIQVTPIDDTLAEGNETVTLTLTSGTGYITNVIKSAATVTIIDNEPTPLGTTGDDNLVATPGNVFNGQNNILFSGAGNDTVDLGFVATSPTAGKNIIDLGSGNDTIYVNKNDNVFGSDGNDTFFAQDSKGGNRISGGAGDDSFWLGANDRALGGDGNDIFRVGLGGGNLIAGGAGADQFWIVNAELPKAANTILDFQVGTDVIGINGAVSLGISALTLKLNQVGNDTQISFNNQTLATLTGIQASSLSLTNPNQFVFA